MGTIEICDGVSTRSIRVDDLTGVVRVDCSGEATAVVVPADAEVHREEGDGVADDPGVTGFRGR